MRYDVNKLPVRFPFVKLLLSTLESPQRTQGDRRRIIFLPLHSRVLTQFCPILVSTGQLLSSIRAHIHLFIHSICIAEGLLCTRSPVSSSGDAMIKEKQSLPRPGSWKNWKKEMALVTESFWNCNFISLSLFLRPRLLCHQVVFYLM